jgi:hypothetical protein
MNEQAPLIEVDPNCPACGSRLRYRGRRGATTVYECPDSDCPVAVTEVLDSRRASERPSPPRPGPRSPDHPSRATPER